MALQAVILPASRGGSRFEILRTIAALILGRGPFRSSRESLSPVWLDPPSVLPVGFVALLCSYLTGEMAPPGFAAGRKLRADGRGGSRDPGDANGGGWRDRRNETP